MARELKNRKDMDPRWQWRLDHIFAAEADYEKAFAEAKKRIEQVKTFQGRVAQDAKGAILACDQLSCLLDRMAAYALMHRDEDGADPVRQARAAKVQSLLVEAESAGAFLNPELLALPGGNPGKAADGPGFFRLQRNAQAADPGKTPHFAGRAGAIAGRRRRSAVRASGYFQYVQQCGSSPAGDPG